MLQWMANGQDAVFCSAHGSWNLVKDTIRFANANLCSFGDREFLNLALSYREKVSGCYFFFFSVSSGNKTRHVITFK